MFTRLVMSGENPGLEGDALANPLTPEQLDMLKERITEHCVKRAVWKRQFGLS